MATPKAPKAPKKTTPPAGMTAPGEDRLAGVDEKGKAPATRLRDAASLFSIYEKLKEADGDSSRNRAMVDAMFDGEPPYDDEELVAAGQSQRCNLDFGEGQAALDAALTGYYDLTNSVDVIARLCTSYTGTPDDPVDADARAEWEQIMSEEFHRTLKKWTEFETLFQRVCSEFIKHGVSIAYHADDDNWQFEASGLNGFLIPRTTKVGENYIEIAIAERTYQLHELYAFIKDEKFAKGAGWNVEEVKRAMALATRNGDGNNKNWRRDWEKLQRDFKNNDLGVSYGTSVTVEVIHAWVREFSGKVSHYISLQDGSNKDFLFKRPNRFASMTDCFTVFTYGIGNGYYHSIRGLGYKLFPFIQVSNRLRGQAVDGAMFSSSVMVQPQNEKALQALELSYVGPYAILPPNFNVIERAMPNVANQVLPVINDLSMLIQNNTGSYRPRAVSQDGQERTAKEVMLQAQQEATLSQAAMNLFYMPWGRLLTSIVRRLVSGKLRKQDPGGAEAKEFVERCVARGVPLEAIKAVKDVQPTRAIGYGSATIREMAFSEMLQLAGALDEVGKNRLLRDKFASKLGGYYAVDAYIPRATTKPRQTLDAQFAALENTIMQDGTQVPVLGQQNHAEHATVHIPVIGQAVNALDQLQQAPEGMDPQQAQPLLVFLHAVIPHTAIHVQALLQNPLHEDDAAELKRFLQNANAKLESATANFQKAIQAAQEQAQAQGGQAQPMDPKIQKMLAESQAKMQIAAMESQHKMALKERESQQRMALRDVQAAEKLREKRDQSAVEQAAGIPGFPAVQPPRAA